MPNTAVCRGISPNDRYPYAGIPFVNRKNSIVRRHRIKGRIGIVDIAGIQMITHHLYRTAETLEVDDLALTEEADHVSDVGIVFGEAKDIVVCDAGFLFCCNFVCATRL